MAQEIPSPLNGLIMPAASPTTSMPGTASGRRFIAVGSGPDATGPSAFSSVIPHAGGRPATKASNTLRADVLRKSRNVLRSPAPTFSTPSPAKKIQP